MRKYKVYFSPQGDAQAVKEGWSWPGFFFTFIWALVKKLWLAGLCGFAANNVLNYFAASAGGDNELLLMVAANAAVMVLFGSQGNKWRAANLAANGFALKGTVEAADGDEAIELATANNPPVPEPSLPA